MLSSTCLSMKTCYHCTPASSRDNLEFFTWRYQAFHLDISSRRLLMRGKFSACSPDMSHFAFMKFTSPSSFMIHVTHPNFMVAKCAHLAYNCDLNNSHFIAPTTEEIRWYWDFISMRLLLQYVAYSCGLFSKWHLLILSPIYPGSPFILIYPKILL